MQGRGIPLNLEEIIYCFGGGGGDHMDRSFAGDEQETTGRADGGAHSTSPTSLFLFTF